MSVEELPLQQTIATGQSLQNVAFEVELRDGRMLHLLCNTVPLHDSSGKIRGAMEACLDVSALKAVERRLRESEERFRRAAEAVNGIIYEYDLETGNVARAGSSKSWAIAPRRWPRWPIGGTSKSIPRISRGSRSATPVRTRASPSNTGSGTGTGIGSTWRIGRYS
jgi:hypothetical protein